MNNIYEHMQKLAFGKVVTPKAQPLNESNLKDKIKELVHSSLGEAKKKKKDVAPQDDTADIDLEMGAEEAPAEETPSDTMTPETPSDIDIDPKVKSVQDYLQKAYANAKELGDEKLMTQIGNTITMVVRNQVLGGQVAESLDEMQGDPDDYYGYNEPIDPKDYADTSPAVDHYVDLLLSNLDDAEDLNNLLAAIEIVKKNYSLNENDIFDGSYNISDENYERMENLVNQSDYNNFINSATNIMTTLTDDGFEVKDVFYYLYTRLTAEV